MDKYRALDRERRGDTVSCEDYWNFYNESLRDLYVFRTKLKTGIMREHWQLNMYMTNATHDGYLLVTGCSLYQSLLETRGVAQQYSILDHAIKEPTVGYGNMPPANPNKN